MPGLTGKLSAPNKLSPAEQGIRQGIAHSIARRGAASVNKNIAAAVQADAEEREQLLTQFEVAGKSVPQELLEQLDMRSELRRERATFEAADGAIAAQYTKQFDPVVMAESARVLDANIGNLSRDVTSQDAKIERKGKLVDLAKGLADLQQTQVETQGKELDNTLKQFEVAEEEITQRMDASFGGVGTAEIYNMINDGRMASLNVPLGRAHRYAAKRRKEDIDNQIAELGLRKDRANTLVAENKLRTSKVSAQNASKQQLLLGMNTEELSALARQTRSTGSFTVDGVTFNQVDVSTALETVQSSGAATRELKLQSFQNDIAADALITDMNEVGFMMNAAYGGGGDAYATMTADDLQEQRNALAARAALEMPDDTLGQEAFVTKQMQVYMEEMQNKMGDLRAAAIARTPEKVRPALLDVTQRGYIIDSGTAIRAMEDNIAAFATIEKGSFYSGAGRAMFNAVTKPSGVSDSVQARLDELQPGSTKKKTTKFDVNTIASALQEDTTNRAITESVSGRVAQGGAISAFAFASTALTEDQRIAIGQELFDPAKSGMKQSYLLPDRPEQINWATAVPEIADMIVATQDGPQEDRIGQLQDFFELLEQGYVAKDTVLAVTGQAKPRTLPEHQIWANARLVNDAVMPFTTQIEQMLKLEAADLATQTTLVIQEYEERFAEQDRSREGARKANANRDRLRGRTSVLGDLNVRERILRDEEFAQQNLDRLARARAEAAAEAGNE